MNEIIEQAINKEIGKHISAGVIVARRDVPLSYRVVSVGGDVATVESVDGTVEQWPIRETFDVNRVKRTAVRLYARSN